MRQRSATASVPPYRLIPRSRVDANWLPTGDRVELLIPRDRDPIFKHILRKLTPPERRWERYPLDPRASRIYALIDGYRTVADLIDIYREEYPHDNVQVASRVTALLRSLEAHGFLTFKRI